MGPSTKYHTLIIFALGGIRNYQSKPRSGKKGEIFFSNLNIFHLYKEEYYISIKKSIIRREYRRGDGDLFSFLSVGVDYHYCTVYMCIVGSYHRHHRHHHHQRIFCGIFTDVIFGRGKSQPTNGKEGNGKQAMNG